MCILQLYSMMPLYLQVKLETIFDCDRIYPTRGHIAECELCWITTLQSILTRPTSDRGAWIWKSFEGILSWQKANLSVPQRPSYGLASHWLAAVICCCCVLARSVSTISWCAPCRVTPSSDCHLRRSSMHNVYALSASSSSALSTQGVFSSSSGKFKLSYSTVLRSLLISRHGDHRQRHHGDADDPHIINHAAWRVMVRQTPFITALTMKIIY